MGQDLLLIDFDSVDGSTDLDYLAFVGDVFFQRYDSDITDCNSFKMCPVFYNEVIDSIEVPKDVGDSFRQSFRGQFGMGDAVIKGRHGDEFKGALGFKGEVESMVFVDAGAVLNIFFLLHLVLSERWLL